jgi:DHA1 family bicyclomycin/chloramphenicol resistance-like MFS transporter
MANRSLDLLLGGLTLLTPATIHLFFPAIPAVKAEFGLSDALAQLIFSAGVFGLAFSTLAYGALGDRYGRRRVLLIGLLLFLVGSATASAATSFSTLLVGRLIQAIGAGSGITLARAIARDMYGATGLVRAIAYLTLIFAVGGMSGPAIGGILIDVAGWRSIFFTAGLAGLAALVGTYFLVSDTGSRHESSSGPSILAGFVELMARPRFCALVFHTGCSTAAFLTLATASAVLMKEVFHRPATEFGLWFALVPLGFVAGTFISTRIGNRASADQMVLIGSVLMATAITVQAILLLAGFLSPLVLFLPGSFLTFAQGLALPYAQAGAMAIIPRLSATAAGIGVFMQNFMGAGIAQIYGLLADGTVRPLISIMIAMMLCSLAAALAARATR